MARNGTLTTKNILKILKVTMLVFVTAFPLWLTPAAKAVEFVHESWTLFGLGYDRTAFTGDYLPTPPANPAPVNNFGCGGANTWLPSAGSAVDVSFSSPADLIGGKG